MTKILARLERNLAAIERAARDGEPEGAQAIAGAWMSPADVPPDDAPLSFGAPQREFLKYWPYG